MVMKHIRNLIDRVKGKKAEAAPGAPKPKPSPDVMKVDVKEEVKKGTMSLEIKKLETFQQTEGILESLRSGKRILLVKIAPLKEKDMTELKRAINRFKTHCAATGADLAAIDDNWVILVPQSVGLERV